MLGLTLKLRLEVIVKCGVEREGKGRTSQREWDKLFDLIWSDLMLVPPPLYFWIATSTEWDAMLNNTAYTSISSYFLFSIFHPKNCKNGNIFVVYCTSTFEQSWAPSKFWTSSKICTQKSIIHILSISSNLTSIYPVQRHSIQEQLWSALV